MKMTKVVTPVLAVIIGVFLILAIGKNIFLKAAIEGGVKAATGVQLKVQRIDLNFFKTLLEIKNLVLFNPKGFNEKIMCEIPEILLDINVGDLFKGKYHIEKMTLDMKELNVIKNADGVTNLSALAPAKEERAEKTEGKGAGTKSGKAAQIQIDELNLKIGKVVFKDYSRGPEPFVKEYNINTDDTYKNIDDPKQLVTIILVKSLTKAKLTDLTGIDVGNLQSSVKDQLKSAQIESVKTVAKDAWQQTQSAAKDTAEKIKSLF